MEQEIDISIESSESGKYGGGRGKSKKKAREKKGTSGTNPAVVSVSVESKNRPASGKDDVIETVENKRVVESSPIAKTGRVVSKSNKRIADKIESDGYVTGAKPGADQNDFELQSKALRMKAHAFAESTPSAVDAITLSDAESTDVSNAKKSPDSGYFGSPDYKGTIDDVAQEKQGGTEKLKQIRGVKNFEELLMLLNDPDFPGIQGSKQFYSGDDLRRIVAGAREMGVTNFVTSSQGLRDTVERLLHQEKEGKIGSMKEDSIDSIAEGFGVAGGVVSEIVSEKDGDSGVEDSSETGGENILEGGYSLQGEESARELHDRARELKIEADVARDDYLKLKHRNESKWFAVKRALFALRSKEPPKNLVDELAVLESNWKYKLTLYKNAVVELAKRESEDRKLNGKEKGLLMAEAIRGLDFQGSIENYNAWKDAAWGNREDSRFLRGLGRAKDWAEQYRALDWKKRMAISALALGTGVAGVATGSAGLVGLGVAGSTLIRLLGSYGVGRVSYEYLEGRANRKTVQYHEAALSNIEKIEDIGFLEQRMKSYADRTQENLNRAIAGNRKRVVASVALGTLLFAGGSAFAHHGAIREVSGKVSSGFSKLLEQMKIITGIEEFHGTPISPDVSPLDVSNVPSNELTPSQPSISVDTNAFPAHIGSGVESVETSPSSATEVVRHASPPTSESVNVGAGVKELVINHQGGSIEEVMNKAGIDGAESHRAYLRFLEEMKEAGKNIAQLDNVLQKSMHIGDDVSVVINPDGTARILQITRKSGEAILQNITAPGAENIVHSARIELASSSLQSSVPSFSQSIASSISSPDVTVSRPHIPAESIPQVPLESLDISAQGSEYLKNVGTIVKERLTFLPLSQGQKDLIENIFGARVPVSGIEPTPSSVLFVKDSLGRALFPSEDVARWMQDDVEHIKEKVNKAVYAGIVRIGGESLRIGKVIAPGETVGSWLTKMAKYILTHPLESKK